MKLERKQILCALLTTLILASTGCSKSEAENPTLTQTTSVENEPDQIGLSIETEEQTEDQQYPLPQVDMEGMALRFLNYDPAIITWAEIQINADEENGNAINDEVFERNRRIEMAYDCVISETVFDNPPATYKNLITAGDDAFDVGMIYENELPEFASNGLIHSWDKLPYADLERSWWDQGANSVFSISGKKLAAVGDFYLGMMSRGFIMVFNKDLYTKLSFTDNLYDLVRDGKWTLDKYGEIAENSVMDLNGDTVMDDQDQYASAGAIKLYYGALLISSGVKYFDLNEEGVPYFTVASDNRTMDVMLKIFEMHEGTQYYFQHYKNDIHSGSNEARQMFSNEQTLFCGTAINSVKKYRDDDFDIGIIPFPKFDEAQKDYYVHTSECGVTTIPITVPVDRLDNLSILLDALCRDSQNGLMQIYKETILKSKYARDEDSSDMLDIIFNSAAYDLGLSIWPNETHYKYMELYMNKQNGFASVTESIKKSIDKSLEKFITSIEENMD